MTELRTFLEESFEGLQAARGTEVAQGDGAAGKQAGPVCLKQWAFSSGNGLKYLGCARLKQEVPVVSCG